MAKQYVFVDFETKRILPRPEYPPRPVGVAILEPKKRKGEYLAWGHPVENNCSEVDAVRRLRSLWEDPDSILVFHNAKFDLEVASEKLELPMLPYHRFEDTMLLAFLNDPYERNLELKVLGQTLLGLAPSERDELREWILEHIPEAKKKKSTWGAYISEAPGGLVGKYASGDVVRTQGVFQALHKKILDAEMLEAYEREKKTIAGLILSERDGMPVDREALIADADPQNGRFVKIVESTDRWIYKYLKVPEFNMDSGEELANALESSGKAENGLLRTATGKRSIAKESIEQAISDKKLQAVLAYRSALTTCIRTFMQPWLTMSEADGRVHTSWRSTLQEEGGGARTGRLASSPNLQNVPTEFEKFQKLFDEVGLFGKMKFTPLPSVRSYVVAGAPNLVLCGRDYSSQELRMLAHFEEDILAEKYNQDPKADLHQFVAELISELGAPLDPDPKVARKIAKTINFLKVYGGGADKLAIKINRTKEEAKEILALYAKVIPGLKGLNTEIKKLCASNEPICTIGGRKYYKEPPKIINGRYMTFEYKLLNYLIQGSSADQTKEAMIRFLEHPKRKHSKLLLTVHDEIVILAPKKAWKPEMLALKESMEHAFELDVPVLSEGEVGYRWTEMEPVE